MQGLGVVGGFKLQIEDRAGRGYEQLAEVTNAFMARPCRRRSWSASSPPSRSTCRSSSPMWTGPRPASSACRSSRVFETLQVYLGSLYVNDFNKFGRTYSVRAQAYAAYRAKPEDIGKLKVPLAHRRDDPARRAAECRGHRRARARHALQRFLTADVNASPAPGYSSGQAQAAAQRIAAEVLPPGFEYEWTDLTYQEILAGNSAVLVFPLAILLVFLVLAAQYESLTLPIAIIMIVPTGILAALFGVWLGGGDNNIFTQIGLVVLVGLSPRTPS